MIRIGQKDIPKWLFIKLPQLKWEEKKLVGNCTDPMCLERGCFRQIIENENVRYPCIREWTEHVNPKPRIIHLIDRASIWIQINLQKINIHVHNPIRQECCIDFMCCSKEWHGTKHEHLLLSLTDAGKKNQNIVRIKKMQNQN